MKELSMIILLGILAALLAVIIAKYYKYLLTLYTKTNESEKKSES